MYSPTSCSTLDSGTDVALGHELDERQKRKDEA